MRLPDFILANREPILAEWEAFARTCTPASGTMDIAALRDHANEMLTVIAADLKEPQAEAARAAKSKGNAPDDDDARRTAAEEHGAGRAESGFTIEQMVSEYRALRASVIRLWTRAQGKIVPADVEDLTRFNEAIDQALAESVMIYTANLENSKEMFLAILGHDLRTPLAATYMSAKFILETQELAEPTLTLMQRIASSSARMNSMVGDLLDFTRTRLGDGIPIVREEADMETLAREVVEEASSAHPERTLRLVVEGPQRGQWDGDRISQLLANLVGNALEHGEADGEVTVTVGGDEREVRVAVHNYGDTIPREQLSGIFHPLKRREAEGDRGARGPTGNLGLGLYIAERIANAHNGRIDVESSPSDGTTFTVHMPRGA